MESHRFSVRIIWNLHGYFSESRAVYTPLGRWSSLHEDFEHVKTPMGLEPFEVRFFFEHNFTKFDLTLEIVIRNRPKAA